MAADTTTVSSSTSTTVVSPSPPYDSTTALPPSKRVTFLHLVTVIPSSSQFDPSNTSSDGRMKTRKGKGRSNSWSGSGSAGGRVVGDGTAAAVVKGRPRLCTRTYSVPLTLPNRLKPSNLAKEAISSISISSSSSPSPSSATSSPTSSHTAANRDKDRAFGSSVTGILRQIHSREDSWLTDEEDGEEGSSNGGVSGPGLNRVNSSSSASTVTSISTVTTNTTTSPPTSPETFVSKPLPASQPPTKPQLQPQPKPRKKSARELLMEDPDFIPNPPPRLTLRLPSFTRQPSKAERRRLAQEREKGLKSCLCPTSGGGGKGDGRRSRKDGRKAEWRVRGFGDDPFPKITSPHQSPSLPLSDSMDTSSPRSTTASLPPTSTSTATATTTNLAIAIEATFEDEDVEPITDCCRVCWRSTEWAWEDPAEADANDDTSNAFPDGETSGTGPRTTNHFSSTPISSPGLPHSQGGGEQGEEEKDPFASLFPSNSSSSAVAASATETSRPPGVGVGIPGRSICKVGPYFEHWSAGALRKREKDKERERLTREFRESGQRYFASVSASSAARAAAREGVCCVDGLAGKVGRVDEVDVVVGRSERGREGESDEGGVEGGDELQGQGRLDAVEEEGDDDESPARSCKMDGMPKEEPTSVDEGAASTKEPSPPPALEPLQVLNSDVSRTVNGIVPSPIATRPSSSPAPTPSSSPNAPKPMNLREPSPSLPLPTPPSSSSSSRPTLHRRASSTPPSSSAGGSGGGGGRKVRDWFGSVSAVGTSFQGLSNMGLGAGGPKVF